jgi:hypothetical protein
MGGNIMLFGQRGIGKTQQAKDAIRNLGYTEVYLNLSVLERVDMGGYPNVMAAAVQKRFVDFLLPEFMKLMVEGNKPVVALLDEVDKADQSLWAPLLEFTQFRSVNNQKLPNLHAIIMTGNLISEGGFKPCAPLLDRAEKYLVEADVDSWLRWAGKSGRIHPAVTAYINDHPTDLFGKVDPEDRYADPSPRGWERSSQILFEGEKMSLDKDMLNKKVSGCIGKNAGIQYRNYYDYYMELLPMIDALYNGEDIRKQYEPLERSKQLIACMITCGRLTTQLDKMEDPKDSKKLPKAIKQIGKFLDYVAEENVLISVRSQIQVSRILKYSLDKIPEWKHVLNKVTEQVNGIEKD